MSRSLGPSLCLAFVFAACGGLESGPDASEEGAREEGMQGARQDGMQDELQDGMGAPVFERTPEDEPTEPLPPEAPEEDPPAEDAPVEEPPAVDPCGGEVRRAQVAFTNQARTESGLSALDCDPALVQAATLHAEDMCALGYFSHTSQDGRRFTDRMDEAGVEYRSGGENIALGYPSPESVHDGWMNSSGHRANILRASFGRIGVGYAPCGGRPYWVQKFAD